MAMNIPAPVQILRYNVPEGTTLSAFGSYMKEIITPGAFIFATGRVIDDSPRSLDNARDATYFPVYGLYVGVENASVPYVVIPIAGAPIAPDELYNGICTSLAPFINDVIGDDGYTSSLRHRGYLGESASNIDVIEFSGIYKPGYGSTLPEEVTNMNNAVVLYYGDRSPHYQILLYFDATLPIASRTVKIYTRVSYESVLSGPEDWSSWQPLGGGSSLTAGPGVKINDEEISVDAVSSFAMATPVISNGKLCGSCARTTDVDAAASNVDNLRGNYYSFGSSTVGTLPFGTNLTQYISLGKMQIATDGERIAVRKHTSAVPPFEWTPWNYFSGTPDSQ